MLAFAMAAFIVELTPGPNMTWIAVISATNGRAKGLAAVAGIAVGLALAGLAAGLGLSALIGATPWLFEALRWGGSLYLLYLAWDAWRDADMNAPEPRDGGDRFFVQGLVTNVLNPKAYLFYLSVVPQFVDQARPLAGQLLTLSALYVAVATAVHAAVAGFAGTFHRALGPPDRARMVRRGFALLLALTAVWFFAATRR